MVNSPAGRVLEMIYAEYESAMLIQHALTDGFRAHRRVLRLCAWRQTMRIAILIMPRLELSALLVDAECEFRRAFRILESGNIIILEKVI